MTYHRTFATTTRVLRQLIRDHRSLVLLLVMPSALVGLFAWIFSDQKMVFQSFGAPILVLFPFILMFVVTSVTTLRERRTGTLERLMTTPLGKGDFIGGYAIAFGVIASLQAIITVAFAVWVCGLDVAGPVWGLGIVAIGNALLGTSLGLLASAFAHTEFQAVQFMPMISFPQVLLGGFLMPREKMPDTLHTISNWLPLSYAVDAINGVTRGESWTYIAGKLGIVLGFALVAIVLASLTLKRQTN
ncbi:MAG: ABC transporter permease [Thermomicrobiales bacterium]|nr:ABC transporter permease [Thermomicrobiales bacterium]